MTYIGDSWSQQTPRRNQKERKDRGTLRGQFRAPLWQWKYSGPCHLDRTGTGTMGSTVQATPFTQKLFSAYPQLTC